MFTIMIAGEIYTWQNSSHVVFYSCAIYSVKHISIDLLSIKYETVPSKF